MTDDNDHSLDRSPHDLGRFGRVALIAMAVTGCLALYIGLVGGICALVGAVIDVPSMYVVGTWFGKVALLALTVIGCFLVVALCRRWWRGDRPMLPRTKVPR